jgi:NADH:ubiquinone oxidoreductase subunit 3 (subunit A)
LRFSEEASLIESILLTPPVTMAVFMLLAFGLYRLGGSLAPDATSHHQAEAHPDKHVPYTGGEELPSPTRHHIGYRAFYRLALLFVLLHVAALVLSTLPSDPASDRLAILYLVGVGIGVFVLTEGGIL